MEIENIHRNLAMGKSIIRAVLDGAREIAVPAFVSALSISIVFVPVVLLRGTAKYLFQPLAMGVVFAMLASYILSRTLISTMVRYLLKPGLHLYRGGEGHAAGGKGPIWRIHGAFNRGFERFRTGSSGQFAPNYWLDPASGVSYLIAVQTPEYRVASVDDVRGTPLASARGNAPQLLSNLAAVERATTQMSSSHYNVQPVLDIYAGVQDRDLGGVAAEVDRIVKEASAQLSRGSSIQVRGQMQTMRESFQGLASGLILAVALVYLVMAISFQSRKAFPRQSSSFFSRNEHPPHT